MPVTTTSPLLPILTTLSTTSLLPRGYTVAGTNGRMTEDGDASLVWKWTNEALDATTYAASANGTAITNLFDESDPNKSSDAPGSVT